MRLLSEDEQKRALDGVPGWISDGHMLTRTFVFADFLEAMRFVNAVAGPAEELGHHPDIDIRYNKVKLALTSHDAGGLTGRDFHLASLLEAIESST